MAVVETVQKKEQLKLLFFVRIKGLEPPRLSASDPKSDVATNYTISAMVPQRYVLFCNLTNFSYFC